MRRGRSQRLAAANAVRLRRGGPARLQQQQATLCSIIVSTMLEQFVGSSRMVTMYSSTARTPLKCAPVISMTAIPASANQHGGAQ